MSATRSSLTRWVAVLAAAAAAGSVAVLAATAAAADTGNPSVSVQSKGTDLSRLTAKGTPDEEIVLPTQLLLPAVNPMLDTLAKQNGATRNCDDGQPDAPRARNLCDTKEAFEADAAAGRTLDLGVTVGNADGHIDAGKVIGAATQELLERANANNISATDTFSTPHGDVTLSDALKSKLDAKKLDGVQVSVAEPAPTTPTPTSPAPTTSSAPTTTPPATTTGPTTSTSAGASPTGPAPTSTTTTGPKTGGTGTGGATPPSGTSDSHARQAATPPTTGGSGPASHAPASHAPAPSHQPAHHPRTGAPAPGATAAGGAGWVPLERAPMNPGLDLSGDLLTPSDQLLARLHQLVPGGDPVHASAPAGMRPPAAHGTVDVRNAGSAQAIDAQPGTAQGKLIAFLGALLGLTLVTVGLARAWVVRRTR